MELAREYKKVVFYKSIYDDAATLAVLREYKDVVTCITKYEYNGREVSWQLYKFVELSYVFMNG